MAAADNISPAINSDKAFDVERLEWSSPSRWSKWLNKQRLPRLRRSSVLLLVFDVLLVLLAIHTFEPLITLLHRNEELFGSRLTLPRQDETVSEPNPDRHAIPKIFHQTAATDVIPENWVKPQQSCRDVYSDFEYKLWTDESARDFIEAEYPWFVDTWDNYPFPIQRADAIRYFVLYHYGGIYLDLDTWCNKTIPILDIESDVATHHAVFKSTTPTGVSNDLMITSPRHPVFEAALANILRYNDITKGWGPWLPYGAIMIAAGPLFITMVIKNYLLEQPALPELTVSVVNATTLQPYMTDLESCSWHHDDAKLLMWLGNKPFIWFGLGAIVTVGVLLVINRGLMLLWKGLDKLPSVPDNMKVAKLT
ncbi:hypothetical protein FZEAL_1411 [Fusarium zealandicum]|uniref:Mannosyl phosphorylinositol ceramide synthase SUR1 n=1 Tax=Fusarium zealandicum TaxID=1053134 RepID=A0A8H4USS3_9HYPO|nr:hypothetical protein FZEAL_1411 [Fusarium zealandicum]